MEGTLVGILEGILESTLERGRHRPNLHTGSAGELPENHLHIIEGFADHEKYHYVGYQEGAAAVFISCIWEPPDVSKADRERHAGHEELQPVSPLRPRLLLFLLYLDQHRSLRKKLKGVSERRFQLTLRIASC